jgi:sugar phosphate isomerase/epimerase
MPRATRREFIAVAAVGAALRPTLAASMPEGTKRSWTMDLTPGAIGIEGDQRHVIELAARHGFESVAPTGDELGALSRGELADLLGLMKDKGLVWGAGGLPVDFRRDDETFRKTSAGLTDYVKGLRRAGVTRVGTWILPCSDTYTYRQYFDTIAKRLQPTARILRDEGVRLGLEYVGPRTSLVSCKYPFLHTLAETAELIEAIGVPGVGYVLDSWHWFLAEDTAEQIRALRNEDVVAVDLNDAPAGIPREEQMDLSRELPAATGIIPVRDFLGALQAIGYDGPVRAEPFNTKLNEMDDDAAAVAVAAALRKAFALLSPPEP